MLPRKQTIMVDQALCALQKVSAVWYALVRQACVHHRLGTLCCGLVYAMLN